MAPNLRSPMKHCFSVALVRAYVAEFIATFIFVFGVVGTDMAAGHVINEFQTLSSLAILFPSFFDFSVVLLAN